MTSNITSPTASNPLSLAQAWTALPTGARVALEQQWAGLAAGGLPCGAAVLNAEGKVITSGRNHVYDAPDGDTTRPQYPLQHTRLAHAELNALARVHAAIDHAALTLWSTQHPCAMCAAAIKFVGIGQVCFVADDPSDEETPEVIVASRGGVPYTPLGDPLWWTISNLLFLYVSAVRWGAEAGNLKKNRDRYPELVSLTLDLAQADALGQPARVGVALPEALAPHSAEINRTCHAERNEASHLT